MLRAALLAILVLVTSIVCPAFGQLQQDGSYRLQQEDVIRVLVYGDNSISSELQVGRDGNITAPFLGLIRAEGLTITELEQILREEYIKKLRLRDPRVSVQMLRFREIRVSVGGAVARPGTFLMRPTDTIVTLFSQAGGANNSGLADLKRATLRRTNSRELIPIDLDAMLNRGEMSQNYVVQDGDELIVPENGNQRIIVMGTINRPGVFPFRDYMTVLDAVGIAGGAIPGRSIFSKITVFRLKPGTLNQYMQLKADLVRFQDRGDTSQNFQLMPGDYIFVPNNKAPDFNQIGTALNTVFFLNAFLRDNVLGLRIR